MPNEPYFPPPESQGGWRYLTSPDDVRQVGGMDPSKLDDLILDQERLLGGDSWGVAIIRHGQLVREHYTFNVLVPSRFDVWSCTKSFTGVTWGFLLDDSRNGLLRSSLPGGAHVDLDTPAYPFIPEGYPLSDPRKERITFRHLLTMTSGIRGENFAMPGMATATDVGAFEYALGQKPGRFGKSTATLEGEPGMVWDYSDPAISHLALTFARIMGKDLDPVFQERVCKPIGIENMSWDVQGGSGFLGPHTNAHTGVHISAREFARLGYLMMHKGAWQGRQVVPQWWVELSTQTSQELNLSYGYTWWVNTRGNNWPGLPKDMFAASGYRSNRCYVVPSLDLVVARVGSGPNVWAEDMLIGGVIGAILK
jgi:CubicO group peptidase (beta-lactamase class C family)